MPTTCGRTSPLSGETTGKAKRRSGCTRKNLKRVLALEYVDMAGLVPETWQLDMGQEDKEECCLHQTQKPQRHEPVSSILLWVESYTILVSILSTHYAEFTGEFMVYQQTIIWAACNFKARCGSHVLPEEGSKM